MFKLASWNVNSLKVRLEQVLQWLESSQVDVLAMQETKLTDENFPVVSFTDKGYHVIFQVRKLITGLPLLVDIL